MPIFKAFLVWDYVRDRPLPNASGELLDTAGDPVPVFDLNGAPLDGLKSGSLGYVSDFSTGTDGPRIAVAAFGSVLQALSSEQAKDAGLEAQASADAAAAAQLAAETAAAAALVAAGEYAPVSIEGGTATTIFPEPGPQPSTGGGGGGPMVDATADVKGAVRLAGDLGGTAAFPAVPGLAGKASTAALASQGAYDRQRANHTGSQLASTISDLPRAVRDAAAAMVQAGSHEGISWTYNATAGTLSAAVTTAPSAPAEVHKLITVESGAIQGTFDSFDAINQQNASITAVATGPFRGTRCVEATLNAGSANGFGRGLIDVSALALSEGDDVYYGLALFLPVGFWAKDSWIEVLRFDNFDVKGQALADHLGIGLDKQSWGGGLFSQAAQTSNGQVRHGTAVSQAALTEGVWHTVEVHNRLAKTDGLAINEVWFDGASAPTFTSTLRNLYADYPAGSFKYLRAGVVSMLAGTTYEQTTIRCDEVYVGSARRGFP